MSRRYSQDRALTAAEADPEALALGATLEDAERQAMPWWYATPMPEPWAGYLWHQWPSAWADVTLRVTNRVWRNQGAKLYGVHRDKALRDDLYDWLIVKAVEAQANYIPRPSHPAPQASWGAWLRAILTPTARQHFGQVMGKYSTPSGRAAADAHNRGIYSTERLDELQSETGWAPTRHPLHGEDLLNRDPASIIIRLEDLAQQADTIERDDLVAGTYSTSTTSVGEPCLTNGCESPSKARGLCHRHYLAEYKRAQSNCSVEGCTVRVDARGLCTKHYRVMREEAIAAGTWVPYNVATECSVDGCDATKVVAKGLCSRHYEQHRRANKGPCVIDGCEQKATESKGMCSKHYRESRRDAPPCSEEDCTTPRSVGTLCAQHYHHRRMARMPPCSEDGCTNQSRTRGLCSTHYKRQRKAEKESA